MSGRHESNVHGDLGHGHWPGDLHSECQRHRDLRAAGGLLRHGHDSELHRDGLGGSHGLVYDHAHCCGEAHRHERHVEWSDQYRTGCHCSRQRYGRCGHEPRRIVDRVVRGGHRGCDLRFRQSQGACRQWSGCLRCGRHGGHRRLHSLRCDQWQPAHRWHHLLDLVHRGAVHRDRDGDEVHRQGWPGSDRVRDHHSHREHPGRGYSRGRYDERRPGDRAVDKSAHQRLGTGGRDSHRLERPTLHGDAGATQLHGQQPGDRRKGRLHRQYDNGDHHLHSVQRRCGQSQRPERPRNLRRQLHEHPLCRHPQLADLPGQGHPQSHVLLDVHAHGGGRADRGAQYELRCLQHTADHHAPRQ